MRGFLRGLWKVDLALTLAVVIALCIVWTLARTTPTHPRNPGDAAQANLQTALTGAAMYYASNDHVTSRHRRRSGASSRRVLNRRD